MIKEDQATLNINVTRNDSAFNSRKITVDSISVLPADKTSLLPQYQPLKGQIEAYLTRFWEIYPSTEPGGEDINYKNFTANLVFAPDPSNPII